MDNKGAIHNGRWHYLIPGLSPDENGNIVFIRKSSVAPAEIYEWGVNSSKKPYELFKWCEDDFYEDSNYCKTITKEELLSRIEEVSTLFAKNGFPQWSEKLRAIKEAIRTGILLP